MRPLVMKICLLFIPVWGICQSVTPSNAYVSGIIVQPSIVDFRLSPGEMGNKSLKLDNKSNVPVQLRIYLNDWERDEEGKHKYYAAGEKSYSCSRWMTVDKNLVELRPGESSNLNLSIKIPDSVAAGQEMKWSMIFIEIVNEAKATRDTLHNFGVVPLFRMGVHVYQTPPVLNKKEVQMTAFEQIETGSDTVVYKVTVKNASDIQVKCKGAMELTNLSTGEKTRIGPLNISMFPGQLRNVYYVIPSNLPKGKYSVFTVIDAGDDVPIEAAQEELEIK